MEAAVSMDEPNNLEIYLTLGLGLTFLSPYYRSFVNSLGLAGHEKVLDFGAGSGACSRHIARRLSRRGGKLDCVDISSRWVGTIQKTLGNFKHVSCYHGDLPSLELENGTYDLVVSHYVFHEIPLANLAEIMQACARLIKPRGLIVFREPSDEMPEIDEFRKIIKHAGLRITSLNVSKLVLSEVVNGVMKLNFCSL